MIYWKHFIVLIHVLSAIVWLGGMFFITLVIVPALKKFEPAGKRLEAVSLTAKRFKKIGWITILILLITGVINVMNLGITMEMVLSGAIFSSYIGKVLAVKVSLVLLMVLLSASHDFVLGPKYLKILRAREKNTYGASQIERIKITTTWLARLNVILAVLIVACAVMLS